VNACFVVYIYNVASSCSSEYRRHEPPFLAHGVSFSQAKRKVDRNPSSAEGDFEFDEWLKDNPETPGARLVKLLKQYLHVHPNAEGERLAACHEKNYPLCFAGHGAYEEARRRAPDDKKDNAIYLERTASMPFSQYGFGDEGYSVWRMRRFAPMEGEKLRVIHNLGTEPSCLALLLAGAAVQDFGVVVELGTYLGLSSKCMGLGFNSTGQEDSYFAFDLFGDDDYNYDKITKNMPWTLQVMPDFKKESSYLWLWKNATVEAYPSAQAFEGFINATTLYPKLWHKKPIALLSVDSAKTWSAFRDQTAGIQRPFMLKKGSILILMDFVTIDTQIKLLYTGCMGQYLQPVYSSYCRGEQWIFVATQTFSLGMVGACMQDYLGDVHELPTELQFAEMSRRAQRDVLFMDSLGQGPSESMASDRQCMMERLCKELQASPKHWKFLRVQ
jgi:hypothetical protein